MSVRDLESSVNQKKRVAAYCRISTKFEEQHKSLEMQMSYYNNIILYNSEWECAGCVEKQEKTNKDKIDSNGQIMYYKYALLHHNSFFTSYRF